MATPRPTIDGPRRRRAGAAGSRPHNLEAEESLLGAMLLSRDAIAAAAEVVAAPTTSTSRPTATSSTPSRRSTRRGEPVDPVTVADELRRADLLDAIGGPAVLVALQAGTPATTNAGRYARIVEEHALLRRLIGVAGEIAELGYGLPDDVAQGRRPGRVAGLRGRPAPGHRHASRRSRDLLDENLDRLEALYERGEAITGVPTGYLDLDELPRRPPAVATSSSSAPGPAMGKTALRPRHGRPRRPRGPPAGAVLLAGDEPPRAHPAPAVRRGPGRLAPGPQRPAAPTTTGRKISHADRPPGRGADLHRRQPQPHGHGDPGQGPPAQEPGRRASA